MVRGKGKIAIMGSGELTSSMVTVHRHLIEAMGENVRAVFLDTPAGFQPNVDEISRRACEYFERNIQQTLSIASFRSSDDPDPIEMEKAMRLLRNADFILVGPGSPTYACRHWKRSPVVDILKRRIEEGLCLVASSAAALAIGQLTLPVYEIYKVGEPLHWTEGIDILGHFGLKLVVIPHWNNAEGGTHDTRYCYMGESRFKVLESMLPQDLVILGIDEHTACILDLQRETAKVMGVGNVVVRYRTREKVFQKGVEFKFHELRVESPSWEKGGNEKAHLEPNPETSPLKTESTFWGKMHILEEALRNSMEREDPSGTIRAILDMDRLIWEAKEDRESEEFISQAREILRESIVALGLLLDTPGGRKGPLEVIVNSMLQLREGLRKEGNWRISDRIRDALSNGGIVVEDTREGPRWRIKDLR